jgi:carboxypeptidase Taq
MSGVLEGLRRRLARISDLERAQSLAAWDERTQMPPGGAEARAEQLATLAELEHEHWVSDELQAALERARGEVEGLPADSDEASLVRVASRLAERARRVPTELAGELARASSLAEQAWVRAREESDFKAFLPFLERNLELRRRYVECFAPYEHPYDPLLEDFEPGLRTAQLEGVLASLRDGLVPLVQRYADGQGRKDALLHGRFPLERQRALAERLLAELPIPRDERRLDTTAHPFAISLSPRDLRITTRYDQGDLAVAVWSLLHETGHAMYENGIAPQLARSPLGQGASLGFHESQSRLIENWVGRSRPFMDYLLRLFREYFPTQFEHVQAERLYRAVNRVERSLIRVDADELTYNLHIVVRFELELALFQGELEARELPQAWAELMRTYLGVEVPDDASGVLQDVHWAAGLFGYFPTYSLGNVIAGQLWALVSGELDGLEEQLRSGELGPLRDWLRDRLHRHGAKFEPAELIERITGGPLDPGPLLTQLERKYEALAAGV